MKGPVSTSTRCCLGPSGERAEKTRGENVPGKHSQATDTRRNFIVSSNLALLAYLEIISANVGNPKTSPIMMIYLAICAGGQAVRSVWMTKPHLVTARHNPGARDDDFSPQALILDGIALVTNL